jgi:hypothetical protein
MLERHAKDKHFGLLQTFVNYVCKKFKIFAHGVTDATRAILGSPL